MSSSPGSAARSARRVAAVSATIRTCWPNAAPPRLIRGAPVCNAQSRPRHFADRNAVGVVEDPAVGGHAQPIRLAAKGVCHRSEVRGGFGGDRRAHRRPSLDRALDDRRVLRLQLARAARRRCGRAVDAGRPESDSRRTKPARSRRSRTPVTAPLVSPLSSARRVGVISGSPAASSRHRRSVGLSPRLAATSSCVPIASAMRRRRPFAAESGVDIVIGLASSCRYLSS